MFILVIGGWLYSAKGMLITTLGLFVPGLSEKAKPAILREYQSERGDELFSYKDYGENSKVEIDPPVDEKIVPGDYVGTFGVRIDRGDGVLCDSDLVGLVIEVSTQKYYICDGIYDPGDGYKHIVVGGDVYNMLCTGEPCERYIVAYKKVADQ